MRSRCQALLLVLFSSQQRLVSGEYKGSALAPAIAPTHDGRATQEVVASQYQCVDVEDWTIDCTVSGSSFQQERRTYSCKIFVKSDTYDFCFLQFGFDVNSGACSTRLSSMATSDACCSCGGGVLVPVPPTPPPSPQPTNIATNTPPRGSSLEEDDDSAVTSAWIGVAIGVVFFVMIALVVNRVMNRQNTREVRQRISERRNHQTQLNVARANTEAASSAPQEDTRDSRYELFLSKFYFQTVLPNKSNCDPESIRAANILKSTQVPTGDTEEEVAVEDDAISPNEKRTTSLVGLSSRFASSWRKPSSRDECCICLEGYTPGQTICLAQTEECNHVFHEECVVEWLENHDKCPLCRVDLMK